MRFNLDNIIKQGVQKALGEYELSIGMTLKEAAEKQEATKPNETIIEECEKIYSCSHCGSDINEFEVYCAMCGQKIGWSDCCVKVDTNLEFVNMLISPSLPLAATVVMEELRKHEDWYKTWVQMLSKCIEECDGQMTNEEVAKCFVDDYLLGSD